LVKPTETRFSAGHEGHETLDQPAAFLAVALEREELLRSVAEQQETLRVTYDRERALATTVRELGSPIIPLLPGVLLVSLVDGLDTDRAQQLLERILQGVSDTQVTEVLLDITAVPLVDTQVANSLIQTTRATTLLGAYVTLVGIRPEIAQSIVELGIDRSNLQTQPSLAAALQVLQRRRNGLYRWCNRYPIFLMATRSATPEQAAALDGTIGRVYNEIHIT
jgi:anti-anti-sigma regulatory factor